MLKPLNPPSIHPPFARYAHGIEIPAGARLVLCSGQLGISKEGDIPAGVEDQAALCFTAIAAILAEAGMGLGDVVRINAFVTGREHLKGYMGVRDRFFGETPPASTLMIVSGFARPEFVVEIEALAARL
ncbi:RidA family protein [Lichenifustis flavocetrariae]|uniref:RidA family protein n=1 Tax=Lichenifustis flavocetrariae TaxID=2949735 RepID=A0AA42CIY7_9HYPH|nr:RidA family protein [Lichenifustis flavocetrariae]MCW6509018.1 RidA family protein [Lichenifustis flavocetrariae]